MAALRRRAADAGRGSIPVTLFGAIPDPAMLDAFAGAGVDRCLLPLPPGDADGLLAILDDWGRLARPQPD